jgi:septal ring factor EnvC (AmiA/AmiB activator)
MTLPLNTKETQNQFMKPTYKLFLILIVLFSNATLFAQENSETVEELSLETSDVSGQFEFVIKESNGWKDGSGKFYEVVKKRHLETLKAHTLDTLKLLKSEIKKSKVEINRQDREIKALKTNLTSTKNDLSETSEEKDSISFLGIQMSKAGYSTMFLVIIALLIALCLFFAFQFKRSNAITKEAKDKLTEVETEYEDHRRNAVEREQKVRRQLQDELNKNKGK